MCVIYSYITKPLGSKQENKRTSNEYEQRDSSASWLIVY